MMKARGFLKTLAKPFIRRSSKDSKEEEDIETIAANQRKHFSYDVLAAATRNFSPKNLLGEGGFGPVYKGRLADGREVAVKRLSRGSRQGAKEFTNEAMLLSRVQHRNVVNLYGYCTASSPSSGAGDAYQEKLLVYEYVLRESVDKFLFHEERRRELDWERRHDIILGVARGLLYLHEDAHTPVIHRDIKASNILLDDKWAPKIADFGMARLFPEDQTHVRTRVAGTNGYMAPEYLMHGQLSTKADVFSFGVLVLELVSGRKNSTFVPQPDAQSLPEWAWRLHKRKQSLDLMDETLRPTAVPEQVELCIHVGLLCTQANHKSRPDMRRVVVILSKRSSSLEEPAKPGFPGTTYRRRHGPGNSASSPSGESSWGYTSASASTFASASNPKTSSSSTPTRTATGSARLRPEKRPIDT